VKIHALFYMLLFASVGLSSCGLHHGTSQTTVVTRGDAMIISSDNPKVVRLWSQNDQGTIDPKTINALEKLSDKKKRKERR
jgi:hypothetical protein